MPQDADDRTTPRGADDDVEVAPPSTLLGRRLSHFHVVVRVGAGGMGIVYKAIDEKLRRPVALKVLSTRYALDDRNREILFREARSAAAVSHPNIAAIHELHDEGEHPFIAMEFVEGETLRARLERQGPLPPRQALGIARQIAAALACAHSAGIVHRDLKPDNVMLTRGDHVKVLDFGIAKVAGETELRLASSGDRDVERSAMEAAPTIPATSTQTKRGHVIGTPSYMAPEQARGEPVDARTDVFAFGVVVYEMLTGVLPFDRRGDDPREWVAATDWSIHDAARARVPREGKSLAAIAMRCMESEPLRRFTSGVELEASLSDGARPSRARLVAAAATIFGAAAVGVLAWGLTLGGWASSPKVVAGTATASAASSRAPAPTPAYRETRLTGLPASDTIESFSLSPDGSAAFYRVRDRVWLKPIPVGSPEPLVIPDRPEAQVAAATHFGRSGAWIAAVWDVDAYDHWMVTPGQPSRLWVRHDSLTVVPSPDGTRIAYVDDEGRATVGRVAAGAVADERIVGRYLSSLPVWSPDGRRIAYGATRHDGSNDSAVFVLDVESGQTSEIWREPQTQWGAPYDACKYAWPDEHRLLVTGHPLGPSVSTSRLVEIDPDAHTARTLRDWSMMLYGVDVAGDRIVVNGANVQTDVLVGRVSPDVKRLVSPLTPLAPSDADESPVGWRGERELVFLSRRNGAAEILAQRTDETTPRTLVAAGRAGASVFSASLLPDGALAYWRAEGSGADRACALARANADGSEEREVTRVAASAVGVPLPCGTMFRCAARATNACFAVSSERNECVFRTFDAAQMRAGSELFRAPCDGWDVAPDGTRIAWVAFNDKGVSVRSAREGATDRIEARDPRVLLQQVAYAPDATSFVFTGFLPGSMYALGGIGRGGEIGSLTPTATAWFQTLSVAPNGAVAVSVLMFDTDLWMIEPK